MTIQNQTFIHHLKMDHGPEPFYLSSLSAPHATEKASPDSSSVSLSLPVTDGIPKLTWEDLTPAMEQYYPGVDQPERHLVLFKDPRHVPSAKHSHTFFEMIYVLSGTCAHTLNSGTKQLTAGDICLVSPGAVHSMSVSKDCVVLIFAIQASLFTDIFPAIIPQENDPVRSFLVDSAFSKGMERFLLFHTGSDERVQNSALEMYHEMYRADFYSDQLVLSSFSHFFLFLLRNYRDTVQIIEKRDRNHEILSLVYANYNTITLAQLAEHLHYTVPYCSKYLKKNLGCTFSQMLKQVRFSKAEEMLLHSKNTVVHISSELGYENPESFIRAFKQQYHMTPSQYRTLVKGAAEPLSVTPAEVPPPDQFSGLNARRKDIG